MVKKQCCCPTAGIIIGILLVVIGLIVEFAVVPFIFDKNLEIRNGSVQYKNWYRPEVPVYMQWYVFNLTNADNVTANGAKPKFTQLGPYTYRENRWKSDITWNTNNGTVTYKNLRWWIFEPEMSNGAEDDIVWSINLPLVTVAESLQYESFLVKEAFSFIAKRYGEGLYKNYTMKQLIWGYHDVMMNKSMSLLPDMFYTDFVGVYAGKNYTDDGVWTVSTGENNITTVGQTVAYNGTKCVNFWSTRYANMVNGTDGTIGQPNLTKDQRVYLFVPDLCRSLYGVYSAEEKTSKDITLYRFSPDSKELKNATTNPDNAGFCTPAGNCLLGDGMMNLSSCQLLDHFNVPVIASLPHFLYGDPKYLEKLEGLHPVEAEHRTDIAIEPKTGLVMRIAKRLQINMYLKPVEFIASLSKAPEMVFPVAWLNESAMIDDKNQDLYLSMMQLMNAANIICYILYGCGALITISSAVYLAFYYRKQKESSFDEREPLLEGNVKTSSTSPPSEVDDADTVTT